MTWLAAVQPMQDPAASSDWWSTNWWTVMVPILAVIALLFVGAILFRRLCPQSAPSPRSANDGETRSTIARNVAIFAIVGVALLAISVLVLSKGELDSAKFVFGAVLPLLGTWVGTILAYYFARENLAAATQSVSSFAQRMSPVGGDDDVSVQERMRKLNDIRRVAVKDGDESKIQLKQLLDLGVERIVIVGADGSKDVLRFLIYKGIVDAFLLNTGKKAETATLKELLDAGENRKLFENSWGAVGPRDTMGEARRKMARQGEKCNDVFVTVTGDRNAPIIGWLTDNRLSERRTG